MSYYINFSGEIFKMFYAACAKMAIFLVIDSSNSSNLVVVPF